MPPHPLVSILPNDVTAFDHPSIRRRWIQNLVDALHACLLKGDVPRANRAWSILVREAWPHLLLESVSAHPASTQAMPNGLQATQMSAYTQDYEGREVERWLNTLRVSAREEDKPSLLHALVLHLIKHGQYRRAYEQLETYLSSYPFLLSGPLHTYAGLLSFYLAQPASLRPQGPLAEPQQPDQRSMTRSSSASPAPLWDPQPPDADAAGLRTARGYFAKALAIDERDEVAKQFIKLIDNPNDERQDSDDEKSDETMREEKEDEESDEEAYESDKLEKIYDSDGYESF